MSTSSTTSTSHTAISESIFNELVSGHDSYYYYYGRNLPFDGTNVEAVETNQLYENNLRKNIVLMKKINANDVAHCAPRYTWTSGTIYDMYDDDYHGGTLTSINVISGGQNYSPDTNVLIESPLDGGLASATAIINDGVIQYISIDEVGGGYAHAPYVTIIDSVGSGAVCTATISNTNLSHSGSATLKNSIFYVLTNSFKVYKCLYNNNNAASTIEPTLTTPDPFITGDGYMWKFMYSIPNTMQNKWLTSVYMPVSRQLTNSYYSNGGIDNVTIINPGSGYTYGNATSAYIIGDGLGAVLQPIVSDSSGEIQSVDILNSGNGYAATTSRIIKSLVRSSNQVTCVTYVDHKLINGSTITISGISGFDGTYDVIYSQSSDGANSFKFNQVGANTTIDFGNISFTNTTKTITSATRLNNIVTVVTSSAHDLSVGNIITISGITGTPQTEMNGSFLIASIVNSTTFTFSLVGVDCSASSGSVAFTNVGIASIQLSGGNLVTVTCVGKHNRLTGDTVTVNSNNSNFGNGTSYTITKINDFAFTYAKSGTNATTTSGTLIYDTDIVIKSISGTGKYAGNSTAILKPLFYGGALDSVAILDPGTGYLSGSSVSITVSGDNIGGTNASLSAIVGPDGTISSTIIDNPGMGYTYANISLASSFGSGARLVASTNRGNIDTLQYLTEIQSIPGAIYTGIVTSGGSGYTYATATIDGDGEGCEAVLSLLGGSITGITFTSPGRGYSYANVIISGNGIGASCRAIMSPSGGHGRDAIKELFASNLMFYSNLSGNDLINGLMLQNEYRQYGIIKNPKYYDSTLKYNQNIGTTCFTLFGTFLATNFQMDTVIKINTDGIDHLLHVVDSENNKMVVIPENGYVPQIADVAIKTTDASKYFTITDIIAPDLDKYSGDMIYINNSVSFAQSISQVIKSRTVLSF